MNKFRLLIKKNSKEDRGLKIMLNSCGTHSSCTEFAVLQVNTGNSFRNEVKWVDVPIVFENICDDQL